MKHFNHLKYLFTAAMLFAGSSTALAVSGGTYTIGTGGDFPDLATAIADLNGSTLQAPLIFNIKPGTYSGSQWQAQIAAVAGGSSTNTVTIQAEAGVNTVTITVDGSNTNNYAIRLNSANYITIKNLTINNTNTTYGRVIDIAGSSSNDSIVGCTLAGATGSASAHDRAVIFMGANGPLSATGSNNVIIGNNIQNGHSAIHIYGTSASSTTDDHIITGNTITGQQTYSIYSQFAGNLSLTNNNISGTATTLGHAIYNNYNQDGGNISGNTININTTSGTHYGIYNSYINSTSTAAAATTFNNNTVTVTVTSGTSYDLYNYYCDNIHLTGNTCSSVANGSGVSNPPTLMYYCLNSTAQNNQFTASATTGGIATGTFNFMAYANNCTVRQNTFNHTSTSGKICSGTLSFLYYAINSRCNNNTFNYTATSGGIYNQGSTSTPFNYMCYADNTSFDSNKVNFTTTTGVIGHTSTGTSNLNSWNYAGTISYSHNKITINSGFSGTSYGIYGYYGAYYSPANLKFNNDTFIVNMTASPSFYMLGYYMNYTGGPTATKTMEFNNNNITADVKGGTFYAMPVILCYQSNDPKANNNKINITSTTASVYPTGQYTLYYSNRGQFNNNEVNVTASSTSTIYLYYLMYYANKSIAKNNTFSASTTGSLNIYPQGFGSDDTMENNTYNLNVTSGSINNYFCYYTTGLMRNNTYNMNATSGTIYNRAYYANGGIIERNTYNLISTTGALYGLYAYDASSGYSGGTFRGNKFDMKSTSGSVYGYYIGYYSYGTRVIGNAFTASTSGLCNMFNSTMGGNYRDMLFFNNTFHSNSTHASNNRLIYQTGGSSSMNGKTIMFNNVFSRANTATGNAVEISDTAYFLGDYNLYYSPAGITMRATSPNTTATSLTAWKAATGRDRNSLFHDPGYMDAANHDVRPNPASSNSWAMQGHGTHLPGDTIDILGNARPKTRFDGVPDLGAYEFTPTSTPPDAMAYPAAPSANSIQSFVFGEDTVASIEWGNTVPSSVNVKQYSGLQASPITPAILERSFFYVAVNTPLGVYEYLPKVRYKDPWIGNVSNETNFRIAKSSNGGAWAGYNYGNGITDSVRNFLSPKDNFDSLSSMFTGVENARIGIRCVIPPLNMQHYDVTAFTATQTWDSVYYPLGYQIIIDSVQTINASKAKFSSSNTYPITGLTENTTYYIYVRTICGPKDTSDWSVDSFRTMITCHAPNLKVTSLSDRQAVVYWDTVQTAVSYEYILDQSPADPAFGTMTLNNSVLSTGLTQATEYYMHVRARCGTIYNISPWATIKFMTQFNAGIDDVNGAGSILAAYPNPVKDVLNIQLRNKPAGKAHISITDITGKVVYEAPVKQEKTEVNMQQMPPGIYLLKYTDDNLSEVIKVNKQ